MRTIMVCFLLVVCFPLKANERSRLESEVADFLGFEETVEHHFVKYKKQLIKLYPHVTDENFELNYGSVFQYGKNRYMESYMKSLSVYSDEELKRLIAYYNSDEGKWSIKKNTELREIILDDLVLASEDFNKVFIEKLESLNLK